MSGIPAPDDMRAPGVSLRRATDADTTFFRDVYASTRAEELAPLPWDDAQRQAFVDHQFGAQTAHYTQHYPGATVDVILVGGEPAGRLYVHRSDHEIRIVDIALLPRFRGRGAGRTLITALFDEARASERDVTIHVEQGNPARRLYDRLGFVPVAEHGIYVLMRWSPARSQTNPPI